MVDLRNSATKVHFAAEMLKDVRRARDLNGSGLFLTVDDTEPNYLVGGGYLIRLSGSDAFHRFETQNASLKAFGVFFPEPVIEIEWSSRRNARAVEDSPGTVVFDGGAPALVCHRWQNEYDYPRVPLWGATRDKDEQFALAFRQWRIRVETGTGDAIYVGPAA